MINRRQFHRRLLGLGAAGLVPSLVRAQGGDYPSRPSRSSFPMPPAAVPTSSRARWRVKLAEVLGKGAVVIVDNIVGAGGIAAAQNVARMAPDGYNLLLGASSHLVQKAMQPSVKFDPMKDFAHITRTAFTPSVLVVCATSPYMTVEDLVAAAKKEPGKLNYASGGVGSAAHLCAAAIALHAKIDVVHVPYKGSVEIVPSIISGATQFALPIASTAIPQIQGGKVRALAVTSAQRMPALPERADARRGVQDAGPGPRRLVRPVGAGRHAAGDRRHCCSRPWRKSYEDPALRADSEAAGAVIALSRSPAEFTKFMEAETMKLDKIVKAANLSVAQLMAALCPRCAAAPLRGVRVLDFSHVIAGPFATFHLAQMGAEVTKVEKPGGGDVMRRTASGQRAFTAFNAGKRMREIDIASASRPRRSARARAHGRRDGRQLPARRAAAPRRWATKTSRPSIRASSTARSRATATATPRARRYGAYDHVIQALTGMTMLAGTEGDPPVKTGFPVIDAATGIIGALAIVIALRERDRTGAGCFLDVSMWASALQLMYPFACETLDRRDRRSRAWATRGIRAVPPPTPSPAATAGSRSAPTRRRTSRA